MVVFERTLRSPKWSVRIEMKYCGGYERVVSGIGRQERDEESRVVLRVP